MMILIYLQSSFLLNSTSHVVVNWKCVYTWPVGKGFMNNSSWNASSDNPKQQPFNEIKATVDNNNPILVDGAILNVITAPNKMLQFHWI